MLRFSTLSPLSVSHLLAELIVNQAPITSVYRPINQYRTFTGCRSVTNDMSRSREELSQMNVVSPELVEAMKKRPFPDMPPGRGMNVREQRAAHLRKLRHFMPVPGPIPDQVKEQEHLVEARDGYKIRVVSFQPVKETKPGPLIVLFHEGGWSMGDLTDEDFNARILTRDLGVTCLNVDYRLAPEHPFPAGINDSWDVLQWAACNASSFQADPSQGFIVGGSSAGGNISAVLAHQARNSKLQPPVTGQWLSVPYLIPSSKVPSQYQAEYISVKESQNDPVLKKVDDSPSSSLATSVKPDLDSPLFSVLSPELYPPTSSNQAGKDPLAKAFFQVAGLDPLRDHALVYDRILREEYGVETRVDVYSGFGHMFWTNWPEMSTSHQFALDMVEGFKWLLAR